MSEEYRIKGGDSPADVLREAVEIARGGPPSHEVREVMTAGGMSQLVILAKGLLMELRDLDAGLSESDQKRLDRHVLDATHDLNVITNIISRRIKELDAKHFGKGGSE